MRQWKRRWRGLTTARAARLASSSRSSADNGRCDDVEAVVGPLADGLVDKGVHRARRLDQARDGGAPDDQERHYLNEYFPWHSECSIGTRRTTTAVVPAETRNDGYLRLDLLK